MRTLKQKRQDYIDSKDLIANDHYTRARLIKACDSLLEAMKREVRRQGETVPLSSEREQV